MPDPSYPARRPASRAGLIPVALLAALALAGPSSCVFRFANAERNIDALYRRIYLPAANDYGTHGGVSARVSQAVRRALALDTRFSLVPASEARVAVDVAILDSRRVTTKVLECKSDDDVVASDSRSCRNLKDDFSAPDASAEQESTVVDLRVRLVDLGDGRLLFNRTLPNVSSGAYDLVGTADTRKGLEDTPQLHALRYVENVDAAYARVGEVVAAQVVSALLSLDSYETRGTVAIPTSTPARSGGEASRPPEGDVPSSPGTMVPPTPVR